VLVQRFKVMSPPVPMQSNQTDCGLFLLKYIEVRV
jgi:Ulp1 family protease